ncbi:MAG TPA: hypothetical protein P5307_12020, partial [Pirellulaceae bacterium]|nr:hypothetical protein [Pirellulaceae bacterium]
MSEQTTTASRTTSGRRQSMLTPVAYSELVMPSLRLARSSRLARALGKVLFVVLVLALVLV